MRIRENESRKRLYSNLVECTDENTKSKAIDTAARYYLRMRGGTAGYGTGNVKELLQAAEQRGSLTPSEIAEILDERELPVAYRTEVRIGED